MIKPKIYFFTHNDFSLTDGGTIRMNGIMQSLIDNNINVILISNCLQHRSNCPFGLQHKYLNFIFSKNDRRIFLLLTSFLPYKLFKLVYRNFIKNILSSLNGFNHNNDKLFLFEYFDNSISFIIKNEYPKMKVYCDIHGIADLEFKHNLNNGLFSRFKNILKAFLSIKLDHKVFWHSDGLVVLNNHMKNYLISKFDFLINKDFFIVDDGLSKSLANQSIDPIFLSKIRDNYGITNNLKIIFFAGTFKNFGGVPDLVNAFSTIYKEDKNVRLMLVGDGEDMPLVKELIFNHNLEKVCFLVGRIDYHLLPTYQSLASLIICPDRMHPYSNMIIHTKYYEALVTGKIVINGRFDALSEINKDDCLSLSFLPSNIPDLVRCIRHALINFDDLSNLYAVNKFKIYDLFSYQTAVNNGLIKYL